MRIFPRGRFTINGKNQLSYIITELTDWRKRHALPKRIAFDGTWNFDKKHDISFVLRKTENQKDKERLYFKTELIRAKSNALIFSFGTTGRGGSHSIGLLQLKGKWQADRYNRLQFLIKRSQADSDVLTLYGLWHVKNNTLEYTYKKTILKTKEKSKQTLLFKGFWEISRENRITYILNAQDNTAFTFKAYLETPNLIGKRGTIKYRAGIGIQGSESFKVQIITLYGVWKLHRKTGLAFEMDYGDHRIKTISFGAFVRFAGRNKISFSLKSRRGSDTGMSVTFSHPFLRDKAGWFLKYMTEEKKPRFELGVSIPW